MFYIDPASIIVSPPPNKNLWKGTEDLEEQTENFLSYYVSYSISNRNKTKFTQIVGQISPIPTSESTFTTETTSPHPNVMYIHSNP